MQLAHAISDSVLVLSTLTAIRSLTTGAPLGAQRHHLHAAAIGLSVMGLAAFVGVLRFAGADALLPLHSTLSAFATSMTMPLLGLAAVAIAWPLALTKRGWIRITGLLAGLFAIAMVLDVLPTYGIGIGALGTMSALFVGLRSLGRDRRGGLLLTSGAVLVLVAGLGVGTDGEIGPFDRIDVFHYLLALANLAFGPALVQLSRRRQA